MAAPQMEIDPYSETEAKTRPTGPPAADVVATMLEKNIFAN